MQRYTSDLRTTRDKPRDGFDLWFLFIGIAIAATFLITILQVLSHISDPAWSTQGGVRVWTDPATGCRYTQAETGMQPLVGPDGRPDCLMRPQ